METREFGGTGRSVSLVGLGGEGILRTHGQEDRATAVIEKALEVGITYFDCARAYAGSEGYYGRVWAARPSLRDGVFQAGKSARRSKAGALEDLETTLQAMHVDHLDLWQIHDVRTEDDLNEISRPGGALEAFVEAKRSGKTRLIGVTGHHDPTILTRALKEWPVDSVMMPINPVESSIGGFMDQTLRAAREKNLAVIAMKILGGGHYLAPGAGINLASLVRFALSQDVTVAIVGCSSPGQVEALSEQAKPFEPMPVEEQAELVELFRPFARRLAFYRGVF